MQYLLLIYEAESVMNDMPPEQKGAVFQEYGTFTQDLVERGLFTAGDALQPVSTATSVRVQNGKTLTTDGPFAETKEQLGGYYLIEAKDLDEAVGVAAKIPAARFGTVEIRPILVLDGM